MTKYLYKYHKWIGAICGLQLFFWTFSGVYFAWFHIDNVKGKYERTVQNTSISGKNYSSLDSLISISKLNPITSISIKSMNKVDYYIFKGKGSSERYNANTGNTAFPLDTVEIKQLANNDFSGDGEILSVEYMKKSIYKEFHFSKPSYRISFDNSKLTNLYFDANTGELKARRNEIWRWYDFMWMMHIMDYDEREDFNNWLMKGFTILGLLTSISGMWLFAVVTLRKQKVKRNRNIQ